MSLESALLILTQILWILVVASNTLIPPWLEF